MEDRLHRPTLAVGGASESLEDKAIRMLRFRRKRDALFPSGIFADPVWDMLLDLVAAEESGRAISVSSLCIAASVPPTTALRWMQTMEEEGLITRTPDTRDGRKVLISLTTFASTRMRELLPSL